MYRGEHKYEHLDPCDFEPALSEIEEVEGLDTWGDLLTLLKSMPKEVLDKPIIGKIEMEQMMSHTKQDGTVTRWFKSKGDTDAHLEEWVTHPDPDNEDYPQLRGKGYV